jgi:hypothetical protein
VLVCLKIETELASETSCFFKKLDNGQCAKKVNFSHALFSLLSLVMQGLVWLHLDRFRVNGFGAVQFGTPHLNLRQPHIFEHQI